jgi:hypothetical protein
MLRDFLRFALDFPFKGLDRAILSHTGGVEMLPEV